MATFLEDQFSLSAFVLPFLVVVWLVSRWLSKPLPAVCGRLVGAGVALTGLLVAALVEQPVVGYSRHLNQLASNGVVGVLTAVKVDPRNWTAPKAELRPPPARLVPTEHPVAAHLVLIIEESFAGRNWTDPVLKARYLPRFSALEKQSVVFNNLYATGSRTTRGLEAILNGFPPLPGISTTERPGFARLPSLPGGSVRERVSHRIRLRRLARFLEFHQLLARHRLFGDVVPGRLSRQIVSDELGCGR